MKTVPAELLAQLGSEPKLEVDISWDRSTFTTYTRDQIVNNPNLSVSPSSKTGTSGSVRVTLDDTSGDLLDIVDATDIHKVPAKLYLAGTIERVLLFSGEITGPITWDEAERTIEFSIESKVEDREVGFSLEESAIGASKETIDKPWPLCFGSVVHVPATKVAGPSTGKLLDQMGIVDPLIQYTIDQLKLAAAQELFILRFQQQVIAGLKAIIPSAFGLFQTYVVAMQRRRELVRLRDLFIAMQQGNLQAGQHAQLQQMYQNLLTSILGSRWNIRVWRRWLRRVLANNILLIIGPPGGPDEMELVGNFLLHKLNAFFGWFQEFADLIPMLLTLFKDTLRRTRESIDNLRSISAQYYSLQDEYCRQLDLVKNTVEIDGDFPQDEEITLYIDGLGWKGTFQREEGEDKTRVFTFTTPGIPEPLHENLATREWAVQNRECSIITNWSDVNIFYLEDPTINLVGQYCLVTSKVTNNRHVIKVAAQEQFRGYTEAVEGLEVDKIIRDPEGEELFTACTYDIIEWPKQEGEFQIKRPGQRGSNAYLPVYGNPFSAEGMPTPTLLAPIVAQQDPLGLTPFMYDYLRVNGIFQVTEEELRDLQALLQLSNIDSIINAPILWDMPTPRGTFTIIGIDVDTILKVASLPTPDWWAPWEMGEVTFNEADGTISGVSLNDGDLVTFDDPPEPLDKDRWYAVRVFDGLLYLAESVASKFMIDFEAGGTAIVSLFSPILQIELPDKLDWAVNPGETVYSGFGDIVFVANLVPSEIHAVMAYTKKKERQVLQPLHRELYTYNEAEFIDPFTVTSIKLLIDPASFGWSVQIYVSLKSSVGPNVVDILEHIITVYTDFSVDATSFTAVKAIMEPLPNHFALLKRQNVLTQLHEIAWQSCLQLDLVNDVFYLRYLPSEPDTIGSVDDDKIIAKRLTFNETVDLVTKMDITWRENYLPDSDLKFILRHNILKYGLHEQAYDWYAYTDRDLIIRAATYWLLRYSNTWKFLQCETPLATMEWDIGDGLLLDDIASIISQADYDFDAHTISYTLWRPVRSGETEQYQFAWPADLDENTEFPTILELEYTGSPGPGRTVATLPTGEPNET